MACVFIDDASLENIKGLDNNPHRNNQLRDAVAGVLTYNQLRSICC